MKYILTRLRTLIYDYKIYVCVILLTVLFGEFYPFSRYPMYDNFPNWSYTFYFEDEHGQNLSKYMPMSHGSLSHLYYTECNKMGIQHGYGLESAADLKIIGEQIIKQALSADQLKKDGVTSIRFVRIYNYMIQNKFQADTLILATTHVE